MLNKPLQFGSSVNSLTWCLTPLVIMEGGGAGSFVFLLVLLVLPILDPFILPICY